MITAYPACFFKENDGYSVIFPDLNYLATCGDSFEEALNMSIDCLAGYIYSCRRDNDFIPLPSNPSDISLKKIADELEITDEDAFINIVTVDVEEYAKTHFEKSVKKTLSIPAWLNKAALEQNINFSQVLQEALMMKLGHLQ